MSSIDFKALKKLADTCRKAGIKSYKDANFEFTLTEDVPVSAYKKQLTEKPKTSLSEDFESDTLTQEQLLLWSTGGPDTGESLS